MFSMAEIHLADMKAQTPIYQSPVHLAELPADFDQPRMHAYMKNLLSNIISFVKSNPSSHDSTLLSSLYKVAEQLDLRKVQSLNQLLDSIKHTITV